MRNAFTAICIAAACAVGLSAQAQTTTSQHATHKNPDAMGPARTVTGCLQAGVTSGTFMLTHAKGLSASEMKGWEQSTTGTTGTTGTMAKGNMHNITLAGEGSVDLAKNVGHEVRVTGRLPTKDNRHVTEGAGADEMSSGGGTSAGAQPSAGSTMTSGQGIGGGSGRAMMVSSVQSISSTCKGDTGGK